MYTFPWESESYAPLGKCKIYTHFLALCNTMGKLNKISTTVRKCDKVTPQICVLKNWAKSQFSLRHLKTFQWKKYIFFEKFNFPAILRTKDTNLWYKTSWGGIHLNPNSHHALTTNACQSHFLFPLSRNIDPVRHTLSIHGWPQQISWTAGWSSSRVSVVCTHHV